MSIFNKTNNVLIVDRENHRTQGVALTFLFCFFWFRAAD